MVDPLPPPRPRPVSMPQRRRRQRWRAEISPMTQVMLNHMNLAPGGPWEDEVNRAARLAGEWGHELFNDKEATAWLNQCPGIDARTAAQFQHASVPPRLAAPHVWYGKINPERPCLYQRVAMYGLTIDEAVEELRQAGLM